MHDRLPPVRPADDRRPMTACPDLWHRIASAPRADVIHVTGAIAALTLLTIVQMHGASRAAQAGRQSVAADRCRLGLLRDTMRRAAIDRLRQMTGGAT